MASCRASSPRGRPCRARRSGSQRAGRSRAPCGELGRARARWRAASPGRSSRRPRRPRRAALDREHRRGRGLADAAGPAADDDVALLDDARPWRRASSGGHDVPDDSEPTAIVRASARGSISPGSDRRRTGTAAGSGGAAAAARAGRPASRWSGVARGRQAATASSAAILAVGDRRRRRARRRERRVADGSGASSNQPLTTTGPRLDADAVLDRERGVDQLVDRRLLGDRHEQHLAPLRIGEQLDDVGGLLAHRSDAHRVEQTRGAR